jgi:putative component of membrane protein insertase Oxa1/YidC/SpoIIIJ protein YidD
MRLGKIILDILFKTYKWVLSPFLHTLAGPGYGCRHHPTCSENAYLSIQKKGWLVGGAAGLKQILNCHPWGKENHHGS